MKSNTKLSKQAKKKEIELKALILALKKKYPIIARYMSFPKRKAIAVNLDKIEKYSKAGETIVVPGKVLSKGNLSKKISIVAYKVSDSALSKIKESKSTFTSLENFIKTKETKFKLII